MLLARCDNMLVCAYLGFCRWRRWHVRQLCLGPNCDSLHRVLLNLACRHSSTTQLLGPLQVWEGRGAAVACQAELKPHRRRTA